MITTPVRAAALLGLLLCCAAGAGCAPEDPQVAVRDARIRAPIADRDMTAGYFTLHNGGSAELVLTGADCADARAVEMHVSTRDGDMMRMRRLDEVVVAAGDTVRFEPGGRHLMLFGVVDLGATTEIALQRRDGAPIVVRFDVVAEP